MKSIFYVLAVAAIAAAGFFGWEVKEKYAKTMDFRDDLIKQNTNVAADIVEEEENEKKATAAKEKARDHREEVIQQLSAEVSNGKTLERTLEKVELRFANAQAEEAKVTAVIKEIEEMFPGSSLEDVPALYDELVKKKKTLTDELENQEEHKARLTGEVAKNNAEIKRVSTKIAESKARVRGNNFQATISSVNNEWDFLIIGAGEKSGLAGDSRLLVQRGGRLIGKVSISALEPNRAVGEIVPGSTKPGVVIRPGDQVILEKVRSN